MIGRLVGQLVAKQAPQIMIDVNGVGYEVDVSMQTFYVLPEINAKVQLYTHLIIREDAHYLFGFGDVNERATFRKLIKVSGIGAKMALGILSVMNADELIQAIATDDVRKLSSVPGIGKKTAERMILELRDKLNLSQDSLQFAGISQSVVNELDDIVSTLLALGYNEREARLAVKGLSGYQNVSDGVRLALKNLSK